ncbi:cilia- and flagella-associated protein 251-like [Culex quinquefasciatus]|uniref:cilia- and flagella-associated protein 251-like n=1 Tax=Culex quinquefasciatus TaxID=7176 RepID=UPI0018E2BE09|nr:cilia- and flagella-associated protein 251-like [Culex quinquefasciatus]
MNGICVALMLGLVASAAAYPYPSKQLRIRQVVVRSAESAPEPEVHDPPSRFPPYTFGKQVVAPEEPEAPAEIVEVPDLEEHKAEEVKEKVEEPFIIKPESNSDDEAVEVEGADEEKKEEEQKKEEEKHEEEEKEKEEYKEEKEEKDEYVKAPKSKEEEHEAYGEDEEKKEEEDSSSSSSEEEKGKSGEYEVKPDAEKDAEIDPLVQAAHYDEESDGKAEQVPKAAPAPKPACGNDKELRQRVEAIIAELHEIKELCCKLEEIESKEEKA